MSLRIIAGSLRGRRLAAPAGLATRPTGERAREALLAILEHGTPPLRGSRFLDLFAGSGAVGLEALSRGAASVTLVEQEAAAAVAIARNIASLEVGDRASLLRADATRLTRARGGSFDLVFLDPPYGSGLALPTLERLRAQGWLAPAARVVVELAAREPLPPAPGFELEDERRYGIARFVFLALSPEPPPAADR